MINKITGDNEIAIAGRVYTLRYDWRALAEVVQRHGDSPNMMNPEIIASIAAIGLAKCYPEMTMDVIMELSPPLIPFSRAVQEAIQWAYFGPQAVPDSIKKKNSRPKDGLWRRLRRRFARG